MKPIPNIIQLPIPRGCTIPINLNNLQIRSVKDLFNIKQIIASVKPIPYDIILWDGEEEYSQAGNWTNESCFDRLMEKINNHQIKYTVNYDIPLAEIVDPNIQNANLSSSDITTL
jgi:NADPH:quinone reductase-like Zn-dependent oxidoreductase